MKQKIQVNLVNPEIKMIASSLFLLLLCSCGLSNLQQSPDQKEAYEIINLEKYGDRVLYHKTLSFSSLPEGGDEFSYDNINNNNFKENWVLERSRHINLDTIFNVSQREEINEKFKGLKTRILKPSKVENPKSLSMSTKGKYYSTQELEGYIRLTYPFFVKGKDDAMYSFIYRSYYNEGILFIYKQTTSGWLEWAKVPIWIS